MSGNRRTPTPANRLGLDYREEAARLGPPVVPIVDAHAHIAGRRAPGVFDDVRRCFGVRRVYSMTQLPMAAAVRDVLGDAVRFIAFPTWADPDRHRAHRAGFIENIERFRRDFDSRILKIWSAPRLRELFPGEAGVDLVELDSEWRVRACEVGHALGMMFMVHVGDPDTWFAAKYGDAARFRTKREHYESLERMLDRFTSPWIAAHMGGWPEDLEFLDGLMTRHPNLHLDTSATKWMVRELSKHPRERLVGFLAKWEGRVLFGSDIVVTDDHMQAAKTGATSMGDLASTPDQAWELYASRYFALRTMLETGYDGESPIADPDLMMADPRRHDAMSAPRLLGRGLPAEMLRVLYAGAAERLIEAWESGC